MLVGNTSRWKKLHLEDMTEWKQLLDRERQQRQERRTVEQMVRKMRGYVGGRRHC